MEELNHILINTYNPDSTIRKEAELHLTAFIAAPGALRTLLIFMGTREIHRDLRQAATIVVKNKIREMWTVSESSASRPELEELKHVLLCSLFVETDNSIRGLMAEIVRAISETEFPEKWPTLIPSLLANVQSGDVLKMYNALLALRKIVKRYEFKPKEARQPLYDIIKDSFPILQALITQIIDNNQLEAAQILRMCLKIFWSCTMYSLPAVGAGVDVGLWFRALGHLLDKRLPEASEGLEPAGQPVAHDERKNWAWWKMKKWAARIVNQFIQRYGNPRYCGEEYEQFATYFRGQVAGALLAPFLNILNAKAGGQFVTDDVHRMALSYVASCVEMSPTYKLIKPHMDFLLFNVIFPTLCLSNAEVSLFSEDPVEFIRKVHNPLEDWLDPRVAATNLLQMLAKYRQKDVLPKLLPFIQTTLETYGSAAPDKKNYQAKDGVFVTIATLFKILKESKKYKGLLEPFMTCHIIPEFQCPVAFIRSRACWMLEYFSDMDWGTPGVLQGVIHGLLGGLRDPSLPVQAAAACSLRNLIEAPEATEILRPIIPEVVAEYFRIMDEVENDAVLSALQVIVEQFGEEIGGLAPMMVTKLISSFHEFAQGNDDDEAAFSATQCLDTISAVLDAIQENTPVVTQLESLLVPLLLRLLSAGDDSFEYLDNCVDIIGFLSYCGVGISPALWTVMGPLVGALNDWAIDYVSEIMVPILNILSKDIAGFMDATYQGQALLMTLLNVVKKVFENDECSSERESKVGATILTCLISCAKESAHARHREVMQQVLSPLLVMVVVRLTKFKTNGLAVRLLETVMSALYYDAAMTLTIMQSDPGACNSVFTLLFDKLALMDKTYTERLIVLSFTNVLTLPQAALPQVLRVNMGPIFQQIIRECVMIEEADENDSGGNAKNIDDDDEEDDDEGNSDEEGEVDDDEKEGADTEAAKRLAAMTVPDDGFDEEQDCVNAEDEAYKQALDRMDKEERVRKQLYMAGEAVDDEDDDEDYTFTSPIENKDCVSYFLTGMQQLSLTNAHLLASLQAGLEPVDKERLQGFISTTLARSSS